MILPSVSLAGQIGGGGNTTWYINGSAKLEVQNSNMAEGWGVILKLSVSAHSSNDPVAIFQVTSSSGTANVHSVTVTSDKTYSYTWMTNMAGTLTFRVKYAY